MGPHPVYIYNIYIYYTYIYIYRHVQTIIDYTWKYGETIFNPNFLVVSYLPSVGKFAFSDPGIYNVIGGWLPGAVPGWCHLWQRLHGGLQRTGTAPWCPCWSMQRRPPQARGSSWEPWDVDTIHPSAGFPSHGGTPKTLDGFFHGKYHENGWWLGVPLFQETSISYHCHWTFEDFWKGAIRLKQEPGPCRSTLVPSSEWTLCP